MNLSGKAKIVLATRYIQCPHCHKDFELTGMRPVNVMDAIRMKLEQSDEALRTKDIIAAFPQWARKSIMNALNQLKKDGAVTNAPYGYWSAPTPEKKEENNGTD